MAGSNLATSQAMTQVGSMLIGNSTQLAQLGRTAYGFIAS
jgi:hypothetical protein